MDWTTISFLIDRDGLDHAPPCVTSDFKVVFKRPTPLGPIHVDAHVVDSAEDRATIEATMTAGGKVTAIGTGTFIAIKPGHPAYHRW
jgi:acyl-coenzyme A thioesterase PaaI-like protein